MTIHFHNTLTREKQVFEPIDPKNVRAKEVPSS